MSVNFSEQKRIIMKLISGPKMCIPVKLSENILTLLLYKYS